LSDIFEASADFDSFYDPPLMGKVRGLVPNDYHKVVAAPGERGNVRDFAKALVEIRRWQRDNRDELNKLVEFSWLRALDVRSSGASLLLALKLAGQADLLTGPKSIPFLTKFAHSHEEYLYSLIFDRGIFAGVAVRTYLRRKFSSFVARLPAWKRYPRLRDPSTVNFAMLKDLTGVDLAVCATNISQKRSVLFSARTTPEFPVVEAVGMSACFPIVFKPIFVEAPPSDRVLGKLRGLWLDGGLLNNIPVHAFDSEPRPKTRATSSAVHPGMLALRLVEGAPRSFEAYDDPTQDTIPIAGLLRDIFGTFMVPGRDGQFLTPEEREQSIDLFTFDLSLFQFSPSQYLAQSPVSDARKSVLAYFRT
jgi:NTE family protein